MRPRPRSPMAKRRRPVRSLTIVDIVAATVVLPAAAFARTDTVLGALAFIPGVGPLVGTLRRYSARMPRRCSAGAISATATTRPPADRHPTISPESTLDYHVT